MFNFFLKFWKNERKKKNFIKILFSCLVTFFGALFFFFASHKSYSFFCFPRILDSFKRPFFFLGISPFLHALTVVGMVFAFMDLKKINPLTLKKTKSFLIHFLAITFYSLSALLSGALRNKDIRTNFLKIILFFVTVTVIHAILLNLLVDFLNRYGICDSLSLFFCLESIHVFKSINLREKTNIIGLAIIFLSACFLVYVYYLNWVKKVEWNGALSEEKSVFFSNQRFLFKWKISFSSFSIFLLKQLVGFIFAFVLLFKSGFKIKELWTDFYNTVEKLQVFYFEETTLPPLSTDDINGFIRWNNLLEQKRNLKKELSSFFLIFLLNETNIFKLENIKELKKKYKTFATTISILILISFYALFIWLYSNIKTSGKVSEMSKNFQERGIYFNGIAPGEQTYNLLWSVKLKAFFLWFFCFLILTFVFNNFVPFWETSFSHWDNTISSGTDLIEQTVDKISYLQQTTN